MIFLIDGYNLLHAIGWATPKMRQPALEPARRKLLDWLADSAPHKAKTDQFRVVFDAMKGPSRSAESFHRGILVHFAYRSTADDLIEELLAAESKPRLVTVISNDLRLHESARRNHSKAWMSTEFLDWLLMFKERSAPDEVRSAPEKPLGPVSDDETGALLKAFAVPKPRKSH